MEVHASSVSFVDTTKEDIVMPGSEGGEPEAALFKEEGAGQYANAMDIEKELQRLQSLRSYHILEEEYQDCHRRFTLLATRYFKVPLAKVVLVDMERCWSLACTGDVNEMRDIDRWGSIYDKAVTDPAMFYCVKDMESDAQYQKMRMVSKLDEYRFFAATPLLTREGHRIGVLAVMGLEPRPTPSVEDVVFLQDTASSLMELLELKRSALLKGVNQSSAGLLRSARFVRDCVNDVRSDDDLQTVLGEQQKEMIHKAATDAEIMCEAFAAIPPRQKWSAAHQKFVKAQLCGSSSGAGAC